MVYLKIFVFYTIEDEAELLQKFLRNLGCSSYELMHNNNLFSNYNDYLVNDLANDLVNNASSGNSVNSLVSDKNVSVAESTGSLAAKQEVVKESKSEFKTMKIFRKKPMHPKELYPEWWDTLLDVQKNILEKGYHHDLSLWIKEQDALMKLLPQKPENHVLVKKLLRQYNRTQNIINGTLGWVKFIDEFDNKILSEVAAAKIRVAELNESKYWYDLFRRPVNFCITSFIFYLSYLFFFKERYFYWIFWKKFCKEIIKKFEIYNIEMRNNPEYLAVASSCLNELKIYNSEKNIYDLALNSDWEPLLLKLNDFVNFCNSSEGAELNESLRFKYFYIRVASFLVYSARVPGYAREVKAIILFLEKYCFLNFFKKFIKKDSNKKS